MSEIYRICSPVQMQRKSFCTTPSDAVSKMLKFTCDEQGAVRQTILYANRYANIFFFFWQYLFSVLVRRY